MTPAPPRRATVAFVFVTVLLDMLALGMIIPVLPDLVKEFTGGDQVRAVELYGTMGTLWATMQFIFSPVLGGLSDRFGRRPVILISNFGLGLDYVFTALAPSLGWLFAARIISGITAASVPTAGAYIADVTPPEKRAQSFGLLGAAFGVGFVLGPALGGLLGDFDSRTPFWVAAGLSLLNGCWGLFVLPESLAKDARKPFSLARANPRGSLKLIMSHPQLLALAAVIFCGQLAHQVLPSCFVNYSGFRYEWGKKMFGLTLAGVGIMTALVQAVLVKRAVKKLGDLRAMVIGLTFGALGFAIYGLAPTGNLFWLGVPVMALWGLANPTSQALMSRRIGPDQQGAMQGAIGSIQGVTGIIGPKMFATLLAWGMAQPLIAFSGAPFLLAASLLVLAMAIVVVLVRPQPLPAPAAAPADDVSAPG